VKAPWDELRELSEGYLANLRNPPPWPRKILTIIKNRRLAATHGGCCGNYGEPGC
jgi:hypothetical protein